jgi:hypothetical protein
MKEKPVTEIELGRARGARIQSLPGRFETSGAVAGAMGMLFPFGLPDDEPFAFQLIEDGFRHPGFGRFHGFLRMDSV